MLLREGKEYFMLIKETISEEDVAILNVYKPRNCASHYMKISKYMKGETENPQL